MGGIPYTSLGCATCKKRKIKCDLGKPECIKCVKKGTPCPGYDDRNFLHHTLVSRRARNGETKRPVPQLVGQLKPLALPAQFNMSAEARTQLFATFMHTFFACSSSLNGRDDTWYLLMARFPTMAGQSELLDRSVIGLASVFLGMKAADGQLAHQGLEIYNSALNAMARILQRNCPPTPAILYAAIVFQTYETMQNSETGLRNCLTHIQGATAMLKHHDYHRHSDQSLIKAIVSRQKWAASMFILNTPYSTEVDAECLTLGRDDSPIDELFCVIAECIPLRKDLGKIMGLQHGDRQHACQTLLHRAFNLEERLQGDWYRLDGKPSPCDRENLGQEPGMLPVDPGLAPYEFDTLETAKTYLLFWVASLAIRRVIYQAEKLLFRDPDPSCMLFYANEICRSVAYCMQPQTRMSAGQAVLVGLSQAAKCYIECGGKTGFLWCQAIYALIARSGFGVALCMNQVEWGFWNAAQRQPIGSPLLLPEAVQVGLR
ncbi:hypothetical protein BO78DRAFT_408525 [Aspergillus sclerotiicarbonarius CBS 121057]|uniref:Zn(2)-C6 fungal-type domain-containing protein n=1 Tax=Aspergillus sclerotiicarbonarius (strain CBS 121057 / IBT 28362) TaxID=1448318 RepID=A0A319EAK9_ASPSB|nr:hypothetical protein BO78DRAFT_408525 [Aspergillus sclerotiicarbonarius CBS 121057]